MSLSDKIGKDRGIFNDVGVIRILDVKEFIGKRLYGATRLLALFNQGKLRAIHLREHRQDIKDGAGEDLV